MEFIATALHVIHSQELKRGVVFIKEIVPKPAISFVANTLYGEHYATHRMRHKWEETAGLRRVSYSWKNGGDWQEMTLIAELQAQKMDVGSEVEFVAEHYWGYSRQGPGKTFEYEVTHPKWEHYPVHELEVKVDFESNYGVAFAGLSKQRPSSVMLAEGSQITVENKRRI